MYPASPLHPFLLSPTPPRIGPRELGSDLEMKEVTEAVMRKCGAGVGEVIGKVMRAVEGGGAGEVLGTMTGAIAGGVELGV